jgi:hypothetical protein
MSCADITRQRNACATAYHAGQPCQRAKIVANAKHLDRQHIAKPTGASRRDQAGQCADHRELGQMRARQLRATGTQRAHHRRLLHALILRARNRCVKHHQAGQQSKHKHKLHCFGDLGHHLLHLRHHLRHIDHQQIGKLLDQRVENW